LDVLLGAEHGNVGNASPDDLFRFGGRKITLPEDVNDFRKRIMHLLN
jgi:hypothetical protein